VANEVRIAIDSPLGAPALVAWQPVQGARIALDSPLGTVHIVAVQPVQARIALDSPLGAPRMLVQPLGDQWADAGFPLPNLSGYAYSRDAGLVRTQMQSGAVRQRRRWTVGRRTATITFPIATDMLYALEEFVNQQGPAWFTMGLVTGDNSSQVAAPHVVRITANPAYSSLQGETIEVALSLEIADGVGQ